MGLQVFWLLLSLLLILESSQALTRRSSVKESKDDVKRRRQHARRQPPISLKPPPQDWPEPELNAGDFLVQSNSVGEVTSLSPLLAYQAKLEQEYLRQKQDDIKGTKKEALGKSEESVKWTTSEEDLKKLLDPEVLLKHNKQLKNIINEGAVIEKTTSVKEQGKSAAIRSLAAMKAVKPDTKKKRKTKSISPNLMSTTTKKSSRRGRKRKIENKNDCPEGVNSVKDIKKKKVKSKIAESDPRKARKRKKKVREFAFAKQNIADGNDSKPNNDVKGRKKTKSDNIEDNTTDFYYTPSTEVILEATTSYISPDPTEPSTFKASTQAPTTKEVWSEVTTTIAPILTTKKAQTTQVATETSQTAKKPTDRKSEIRSKRKEVREEMKKVLKAEQLEGSFSDNSSIWTTSETRKIPIYLVTPRHALLNLLKHNMANFIKGVFRESSKLAEKFKEDSSSTLKSTVN